MILHDPYKFVRADPNPDSPGSQSQFMPTKPK
jgi:hypothetical protein